MMYMDDAIEATINIMEAPSEQIKLELHIIYLLLALAQNKLERK